MIDVIGRAAAVMGVGWGSNKLGESGVAGGHPATHITTGWTSTSWRFETIGTKVVMLPLQ